MQVCCVIGKPRSGTTVLKEMLAGHPKIVNFGEIFRETGQDSFFSFMRDRVERDIAWLLPSRRTSLFLAYMERCQEKARSYKKDATTIVIDVKYDQAHLVYDAWRELSALPVFFDLIRNNGWRVIDLRRRSIISMIISNEIAIATNIYHSRELDREHRVDAKIRLDPKKTERKIRGITATYNRIDRFFAGYDSYRCFYYEDLFDNDASLFRGEVLETLSSLLNLENVFSPQPALRKLLRADPLSYVENADEIGALLARLNLALPG